MPMAASSLFLSPPLPQTLVVASSLISSSPKPRSHRKNHLRPKLPPKTQTARQLPILIADDELGSERFLTGALSEKSSGGRGKLGPMKRLGFVRSNVMRWKNVCKRFDGEKKMEEGGNAGDNGGIQQIAHQNPLRESPNLHEPQQSSEVLYELSAKPADAESLVLPCEKSSDVNNLQTSQRSTERSKMIVGHIYQIVNPREERSKASKSSRKVKNPLPQKPVI